MYSSTVVEIYDIIIV